MAQLAGDEPARMRLLACGRCATQWRYGRTMCPFCETDSQKLTSIAIEGEGGLRIDHCESCKGYLKTYAGHGDEAVLQRLLGAGRILQSRVPTLNTREQVRLATSLGAP